MIKIDMPMPTNCIDCPACNEYLMCAIPANGRGCGENDVKDFSQGRPEWCPMKEQELVRCKDCRKRYTPMCQLYFGCPKQKDSFFCADGEQK